MRYSLEDAAADAGTLREYLEEEKHVPWDVLDAMRAVESWFKDRLRELRRREGNIFDES